MDLFKPLHFVFDPCHVRFEDNVFGISFETSDFYEIWVSKTTVRNHMDILQKIKNDPCPENARREWLRYGYVIIAEKRGSGQQCIQIEIYP